MTDPAARLWWWGKHPPFLGGHVAGLWTDLGEPERHPGDMTAAEKDGLLHITLGIGAANGEYTGKLHRRACAVEIHRVAAPPVHVQFNGQIVREFSSASSAIPPESGYRFDPRLSRLEILVSCNLDSVYTLSLSYSAAP